MNARSTPMIAMAKPHALIQLAAFCVSVTSVSLEMAPAAPVSETIILHFDSFGNFLYVQLVALCVLLHLILSLLNFH